MIFILLLAVSVSSVPGSEAQPVYVLEYPGVAFGYLPEVMVPPLEGTLTEESGVLTNRPNEQGVEVHLYYWKEDLGTDLRKDHWLSNRFRDIVPPDLFSSMVVGFVDWMQCGTGPGEAGTGPVGLVPRLNFNIIDESGKIRARGRAFAAFTGDYSLLFYILVPEGVDVDVEKELTETVDNMYLLLD